MQKPWNFGGQDFGHLGRTCLFVVAFACANAFAQEASSSVNDIRKIAISVINDLDGTSASDTSASVGWQPQIIRPREDRIRRKIDARIHDRIGGTPRPRPPAGPIRLDRTNVRDERVITLEQLKSIKETVREWRKELRNQHAAYGWRQAELGGSLDEARRTAKEHARKIAIEAKEIARSQTLRE